MNLLPIIACIKLWDEEYLPNGNSSTINWKQTWHSVCLSYKDFTICFQLSRSQQAQNRPTMSFEVVSNCCSGRYE